jgi:hypothetical protein
MYNLTIAGLHTYYIHTPTTDTLVHNECDGTTSLYRVSPNARGEDELKDGLDPANFPKGGPENDDGMAHFGNKARGEDFARSHAGSHRVGMRVVVPNGFLEHPAIDTISEMMPGQTEYGIPTGLFEEFNGFPRLPWTPGK